jgi:three-Cys-motif partner protein
MIEQTKNRAGDVMIAGDGLPIDEVGPWAKEKHERLRKYVDIFRAARRKWIKRSNPATYVDLYCGSGRAIIRDTGEIIDGSPLVAFKSAQEGGVPFSEMHIADAIGEKCRAAERRILQAGGAARVEIGKADRTAARIAKKLNRYGLHFVFLDPYKLEDLPFSVIEAFAGFKHVDMLIHVSAMDLQRNLDTYSVSQDSPLDRFAPSWRKHVNLNQTQAATRAAYISFWASKMEKLGLPPARRAELVSGTKNQPLYWLVFVSRNEFAKRLWDKIRIISGQGELPV